MPRSLLGSFLETTINSKTSNQNHVHPKNHFPYSPPCIQTYAYHVWHPKTCSTFSSSKPSHIYIFQSISPKWNFYIPIYQNEIYIYIYIACFYSALSYLSTHHQNPIHPLFHNSSLVYNFGNRKQSMSNVQRSTSIVDTISFSW